MKQYSAFLLLSFLLLLPLLPMAESTKDRATFFSDLTQKSKLNFQHDPKVQGNYFFPEVMGAGCAFFDFDADQDLDIYLVNGSDDSLFRQEVDGTFTDVSKAAGIEGAGYGMGVAAGDFDNDADLDLFLSNYGPNQLYRNNGNGTFTDVTSQSGINTTGWSTSAVFFDYDRDGFLDLYVTRYVKLNPSVICTDRAGRKDYCGPDAYEPETDILYRNAGNGTFTDQSLPSGITRIAGKGLGVVSADFNADDYPDLYVANDREPNQLWINQKNGTFKDQALPLGVALNALGQPEASMGIAVGDINSDSRPDLFVTNLRNETNTLYINQGQLGFQDDSLASGLGPPSLPFTGFGTGFFDLNNDGDLDVAIVNGRVIRGALLTKDRPATHWDPYKESGLLFENNAAGRFQNISNHAGAFTSDLQNARGLAFGDVDNDGDIDLLVSNCGGPARLYENTVPSAGHWLTARVIDPALKRDAIGATVTITLQGKNFTRWVNAAYSYLSSSDPRVHFGLGAAGVVDRITVRWPDGTTEVFRGIDADQIITIRKGMGK